MPETSDESIEALEVLSMPDHDFDKDVIGWIRDAKNRLRDRGYGGDTNNRPEIYVGDRIYYDALSGDYFDIRDEVSLTVYGSKVYRTPTLPEYRIMVVDSEAMHDVKLTTGPSVMHGEFDASDPPTPTTVTGQLVQHPDAIEFVPETEVDYGDV